MKIFEQALKFGIVGVVNTLLTLIIIWTMTNWGGCSEVIANFTGYVAGLISSFIFNKLWTFKSTVGWRKSAVRFFLVWAICYVIQLLVLVSLHRYLPDNPPLYAFFSPLLKIIKIEPAFFSQMLAMVVFTLFNFIINKLYTFKA
ncbi:MAG: GtrA family protein [Tannerella sp.]|jgi:putative flippase GtrA|nr:GtrA family protein [Tannerella sp.]